MRPREHPSNINAVAGFNSTFVNFTSISETFHQLSVRPRDLTSTFINILSDRGKHFVWKLDLLLNLRQISAWPRVLLSRFCASAGPTVIYCTHSVLPWTSVNLCQLFVRPWDLPSTFRASAGSLPTFRASEGPSIEFPYIRGRSINFRQLSVHPRDYPSNLCVSGTLCHLQ